MSEPRAKNAHLWVRHPQDYYVEPHWCSERLFEAEAFQGTVWDPACGSCRITEAAKAAGYDTVASDLIERSIKIDFTGDFFTALNTTDNIVSNPPFGVADRFAALALVKAAGKVALLLPTKWMNSAKRGAWLETTPLARVWLLAPRPSMPPGPVIEAGEKPGNGTTDFAWFVWSHGHQGAPVIGWLRRDAEIREAAE